VAPSGCNPPTPAGRPATPHADGTGAGPDDIIEDVLEEVLPRFKAENPHATAKMTKRAILIETTPAALD
jgi:hypothetical protein